MGARVEGKKKKKGVKANVTSKFNSKRKASRMGKQVKKGQMGPNTEFITRSSALKRLQITLKDFRRLCILKGVYPRVPTKGLKGNDKVYYDIKDISYIMHEPLLKKFRDFKTFMKKIRKASGRNQFDEARRKDELKPQISLNHLVKERYPRFIDALRDLDDALCMIHLFAALPSVGRVTAERTVNCMELCNHWQYYVSKSRTLQKAFISVKGAYYQAEIMGEPVTWLEPHKFTQVIPKEVDVRVMMTFLEFYEVFVKFVLFKLYHSIGINYPPQVDKKIGDSGASLLALKSSELAVVAAEATNEDGEAIALPASTVAVDGKKAITKKASKADPKVAASESRLKTLPKVLSALAKKKGDAGDKDENGGDDDEDEEVGQLGAPLEAVFSGLQQEEDIYESGGADEAKVFTDQEVASTDSSKLFSKLIFFINREVVQDWLHFCVASFGGKVGWDSPQSPFKADDSRITHHVVDRPMQGVQLAKNREYVQPQWVFDSINAKLLLPVENYGPGKKLPPHLSPFVDDEKEGYMPKYREEVRKLQNLHGGAAAVVAAGKKSEREEDVDNDEDEEFSTYQKELGMERAKKTGSGDKEEEGEAPTRAAAASWMKDHKEEIDSENSENDSEEEDEEEKLKEAHKNYTKTESSKSGAVTKGLKAVPFKTKQQDFGGEVSSIHRIKKHYMMCKIRVVLYLQ